MMLFEEYKQWLKENRLPSTNSEDGNPIDDFVKSVFKDKRKDKVKRMLMRRPELPSDAKTAMPIVARKATNIGLR